MMEATFGQRLYALRQYYELSLHELAKATGISHSNLNRYERDVTRPTSEYLKTLCKFYRVSSDYLLFGLQRDVLHHENWDKFDPQLQGMVRQLAAAMEEPHKRSWAIAQFERAFRAY